MTGMEAALAIPPAIDLSITWGRRLMRTIKTARRAGPEIEERVQRVELLWARTEAQLKFLNQVPDSVIDNDLRDLLQQSCETLRAKLQNLSKKVDGLVRVRPSRTNTAQLGEVKGSSGSGSGSGVGSSGSGVGGSGSGSGSGSSSKASEAFDSGAWGYETDDTVVFSPLTPSAGSSRWSSSSGGGGGGHGHGHGFGAIGSMFGGISGREAELSPKRLRYVSLKQSIDKAFDELDAWQKLTDPSWFLLLRNLDPRIDDLLQQRLGMGGAGGGGGGGGGGGSASGSASSSSSALAVLAGGSPSIAEQRPSTLTIRSGLRPSPDDGGVLGGGGGGAAAEPAAAAAVAAGGRDGTKIFLPADELAKAVVEDLPYSDFQVLRRPNSSRLLVLDRVAAALPPAPGGAEGGHQNHHQQQPHAARTLERDVRDLARKLRHDEPLTFRLLVCKGVMRNYAAPPSPSPSPSPLLSPPSSGLGQQQQQQRPGHARSHSGASSAAATTPQVEAYTMVFRVPAGMSDPRSLRERLLAGTSGAPRSLSERFAVAQSLAKAVSYVHTFGFVHKDIRPETVLTFLDNPEQPSAAAASPSFSSSPYFPSAPFPPAAAAAAAKPGSAASATTATASAAAGVAVAVGSPSAALPTRTATLAAHAHSTARGGSRTLASPPPPPPPPLPLRRRVEERQAFLVGFGHMRRDEGATLNGMGDAAGWERDLYRHPGRQRGAGAAAAAWGSTTYYVMQHDIYSLGVCLLEVGLWRSFVAYDDDDDDERGHDGAAAVRGRGARPRPSRALGLSSGRPELADPVRLKEHLLSLARNSLPKHMGNRYAEVVETCLTCLDEDNMDFGDEREFQDQDGILVAVRYIERVLGRLNSINI